MTIHYEGKPVGSLTNRTWSYELEKSIGFALVSRSLNAGDEISIETEEGVKTAKLVQLPFI